MIDILNIALALVSIALGAVGWLAPRYTMGALDLETAGSTMGLSEMRAASGALFIGLGLGALVIGTPSAFAMIGFAWGGAAVGRATSLLLDDPKPMKKIVFFIIEVAVAAPLLILNL